MKVGIIGSGGREHSICHALKKSKKVNELYCFPGNAGTAKIANNVDLDITKFKNLKDFILSQKIELIIIGPEQPLVDGIVDYLEEHKIKVFGPNKIASQLEGSKILFKSSVIFWIEQLFSNLIGLLIVILNLTLSIRSIKIGTKGVLNFFIS